MDGMMEKGRRSRRAAATFLGEAEAVVNRLLRGDPLELVARELDVTIATMRSPG